MVRPSHQRWLPLQLLLVTVSGKFNCHLDPPSGAICNVPGTVASPNPGPQQVTVTSYGVCSQIANQQYLVTSFAYDTAARLCTLYNSNATSMAFTPDSTSPTNWTDTACYKCRINCNVQTDVEVFNGGFNFDATHIGPWSVGGDYSLVPGRTGGYAFYSNASRPALSQDLTGLCVDKLYTVRFDYLVNQTFPTGTAALNATAEFGSPRYGSHAWSSVFTPTTYGVWTTFTDYFYFPYLALAAELDLSIALTNPSSFPFTVDNVFFGITPVTFSPAPNALNLLSNPGFESGLSPWYAPTTSPGHIVTPGINSNYSYLLPFPGGQLSQNVHLTAGTLYLLTFDYDAKAFGGSVLGVTLVVEGGGGFKSQYPFTYNIGNGDATFSETFTARGTGQARLHLNFATFCDFYARPCRGQRTDSILVDNFSLVRAKAGSNQSG